MSLSKNEKVFAKEITVSYNKEKVLEDVSVELFEGELVAILGLSGVGKSTLFHVMAGLLKPNRGKVLFNGQDITGSTGHVSYMLQKDLLLPFKTILDNVALPLIIKKQRNAKQKASEFFKEFGLEGSQKKYPHQLSGGMRQRAALLRTYMFSNEVFLLDEPFSALDAITKSQMHIWYLDILQKIKMSTFFITHDIDEAILLSDRIYILAGKPGRISGEIKINIPRPREQVMLTQEFLEYKKKILKLL